MIPLPAWLDPELWTEYVQQRKKDKKEMSPRSARDRLARLYALKEAGHDPNACIAEALNGHWLDFYAPQDKAIVKAPISAVEETKKLHKQWEEASQQRARPDEVRAILARANIRRVA